MRPALGSLPVQDRAPARPVQRQQLGVDDAVSADLGGTNLRLERRQELGVPGRIQVLPCAVPLYTTTQAGNLSSKP